MMVSAVVRPARGWRAISLAIATLALAACSSNSAVEGTPVTSFEQIEGTWSAVPERGITLVIGADGSLSGNKVCTSYLSGLTLDSAESTLIFEPALSDAIGCGEPGDSDWNEFQEAISGSVPASVIDSQLVFNAGTNREVRLIPLAPS